MRISRARSAALIMTAVGWFAVGCSSSNDTDELNLTQVIFPNGVRVNAETMRSDAELMRGLMFRESLPAMTGALSRCRWIRRLANQAARGIALIMGAISNPSMCWK